LSSGHGSMITIPDDIEAAAIKELMTMYLNRRSLFPRIKSLERLLQSPFMPGVRDDMTHANQANPPRFFDKRQVVLRTRQHIAKQWSGIFALKMFREGHESSPLSRVTHHTPELGDLGVLMPDLDLVRGQARLMVVVAALHHTGHRPLHARPWPTLPPPPRPT
jgi:hypothetical protein